MDGFIVKSEDEIKVEDMQDVPMCESDQCHPTVTVPLVDEIDLTIVKEEGEAQEQAGPSTSNVIENPKEAEDMTAESNPFKMQVAEIFAGGKSFENLNQLLLNYTNDMTKSDLLNGWGATLKVSAPGTGDVTWFKIRRGRPEKRTTRCITFFPRRVHDHHRKFGTMSPLTFTDPMSPRLPLAYMFHISEEGSKKKGGLPKPIPTLNPTAPGSMWNELELTYGICFVCGNRLPEDVNKWCSHCVSTTSKVDWHGACKVVHLNPQLTGEECLLWEMINPECTWVDWFEMGPKTVLPGTLTTCIGNRYVTLWLIYDPDTEVALLAGKLNGRTENRSKGTMYSTRYRNTKLLQVAKLNQVAPLTDIYNESLKTRFKDQQERTWRIWPSHSHREGKMNFPKDMFKRAKKIFSHERTRRQKRKPDTENNEAVRAVCQKLMDAPWVPITDIFPSLNKSTPAVVPLSDPSGIEDAPKP